MNRFSLLDLALVTVKYPSELKWLASILCLVFAALSLSATTMKASSLTTRTVGNRQTTIASRDGVGRPLTVNTKVNTAPRLNETMTWSSDGLLATYTADRIGDFTDSRLYSYADLSRRLAREKLNLNASATWTNSFCL